MDAFVKLTAPDRSKSFRHTVGRSRASVAGKRHLRRVARARIAADLHRIVSGIAGRYDEEVCWE